MKAMILAAGLGTRLRPLTDKIPKPLIPVNGIPLLFYNLALLKHHGFTDLVINLHYLGEQIEEFLQDGTQFGFRIKYSHEPEILGTGGGIFKAQSQLLDTEDFLVINGDIVTDVNLTQMLEHHHQQKNKVTLAVIPSQNAADFGVLKYEKGLITSMLGQPVEGSGQSTFFSGIHILNRELFSLPVPKGKFCIVRDVYIPMLKNGSQVSGFIHQGYWNDLGTHERLKSTEAELVNHQFSFNESLIELKRQLKMA